MKLSRSTIYRWRKSNIEFRERLDRALESGRNNVSDMAETILVQKVQAGDMVAIKFWLQHNNSKYIPVRTVYVEPPGEHTPPRLGIPCKHCGHFEMKGGFDPTGDYKKKKRKDLIRELIEIKHKKEAFRKRMEDHYSEELDEIKSRYNKKIEELEAKHGPVPEKPDEHDPNNPRMFAYE